ncbi:hypothetical protein HDV01_001702 [Terramyces sp. JEL0728]|nr:hypothetical protein HDV01_001702 [Terramyces sp. JEL0728]
MRGLKKPQTEMNGPKALMLNMIQAITVANLVCWIPMIYDYSFQLYRMYHKIGLYDDNNNETGDPLKLLAYYAPLYLFDATVAAKGMYHIIALYLSQQCTVVDNNKTAASIELETIHWSSSKQEKPDSTFKVDEDTLR